MRLAERFPTLLVMAVVFGGLGLLGARVFDSFVDGGLVKVRVPTLSTAALRGKAG